MAGLIWGSSLPQGHREEQHRGEQPAGVEGNLPFPFLCRTAQGPHSSEKHPLKQQPALSKKDNVSPGRQKAPISLLTCHCAALKWTAKPSPQGEPQSRSAYCAHVAGRGGRAARCLGPDQKPDTTQAWITGKEPFFSPTMTFASLGDDKSAQLQWKWFITL